MLLVCPSRLTPHFKLEIGNAGRRFSLYQGPRDLFRWKWGVFSHVIAIYAVVFKYSIMNVYLEVCMIKVEEILSTLSPNQKVNYDKVFQKMASTWQEAGL